MSRDVIHRDLEPWNLFIDEKFRIHIGDLGIARIGDSGATSINVVGTTCYMATEVLKGEVPSKKVDVFAFGLILYEILVGKSVFPKNEAPGRVVARQIEGFRPTIPEHSVNAFSASEDCETPMIDIIPGIEQNFAPFTIRDRFGRQMTFLFSNEINPEFFLKSQLISSLQQSLEQWNLKCLELLNQVC